MNRIVIVDDHFLLRAGWSYLIDPEDDLEICGEAGSVQEALAVIEKSSPDLVITDLSLPGRSGLDLVKELRERHPDIPVLVVSMHDEVLYAERVIKAGGRGYLMKESVSEQLVSAIRQVLSGKLCISPEFSDHLLSSSSRLGGNELFPLASLTNRELEVFELIGRGKSLEEIATTWGICARTVEAHRSNIRKKLGYPDSNALLRYAVRWTEARRMAG